MHQFQRNTGLMVKTFLYQIVMSLFGIMMYSVTHKNPFLFYLGQGTVILFFLYIMSSQMYQYGAKSCEYDWAHKCSSSPLLGFVFALIAFLPTLLASAWTLITPPFDLQGVAVPSGYVPFLLNKTFLQGMYIGISQTLYPTVAGGTSQALAAANGVALNSQCLIHLLSSLPGVLFSGVFYWIGYNGFRKNKKKKDQKS